MSDDTDQHDATVRRPNDPLLGAVIDGRFEVRSLLGRGGMGAVYVAYQPSVGREVALKVLHGHFRNDDELVKRFEREIRLCAQLSHPNVVTVHDAGVSNGVLFMAMERLAGHSLAELIAAGPLEPKRAVHLAAQICDALAAAHERGIVHRDIKPSNVMVLERDHVKVLDFGIATVQEGERLTKTNGLLGSPNAIAPEVIKSAKNVSAKADLYAVGTLLYEALTGTPPFGTDGANAVFMRQVSTTAPTLPATLPPGLRALVTELIDADPEKRPRSAMAVKERLLAPGTLAVSDTVTVMVERGRVSSRRALGSLIVFLALAVPLTFWLLGRNHEVQRAHADAGQAALPPPDPLPLVAPPEPEDAGAEPTRLDAGALDAGVPKTKHPGKRPGKKSDYEQ
ncbi:MAG: serine/threonine protein kinase [Archangiaceae bacterium]|nr:serine/threonine protein kinase [Archangiaceae bacterium]